MKKGQPIDDIFRDKLKDYELEAPMHLWDAIAEAGPQTINEGNRRKVIVWWLGLLALCLGTAVWLWWSSLSPSKERELQNFPVAVEFMDDKIEEQLLTPSAVESLPTKRKSPKDNPLRSSTTGLGNDKLIPSRQMATPALSNSKNNSPIAESFPKEGPSPIGSKVEQERKASPKTVEVPLATSFRLALLNTPGEGLIYPSLADSLSFSLPKERSWRTTVDIMGSMDFSLRSLEPKDPAFAAYAKRRDDTETFRHGTSIGMRLSTVSDNGLAVRSGLNYSTINEQLNLKTGEEERLIAQIKYAENGSIVGTDTTLALVGTYRIVNNRFTELDIPLLVGYEYSGQKVSFSFNGGILINMLSAQKGEFLSPNTDESVSFSSSDPTSYRAFKNRLGIGFYGSMGAYFQINDNLQFLLEPYLKWRPGSYTVDGYILDQHYMTTGLFVGIRKEIY